MKYLLIIFLFIVSCTKDYECIEHDINGHWNVDFTGELFLEPVDEGKSEGWMTVRILNGIGSGEAYWVMDTVKVTARHDLYAVRIAASHPLVGDVSYSFEIVEWACKYAWVKNVGSTDEYRLHLLD